MGPLVPSSWHLPFCFEFCGCVMKKLLCHKFQTCCKFWGSFWFFVSWVLQHVSYVYVVLWFFVLSFSLSLSLSLTNSLKFLKICSPGEVMMLCHIFDFVCSLLWPHIFYFVCNRKQKGRSNVFSCIYEANKPPYHSLFNSCFFPSWGEWTLSKHYVVGKAWEATGFSRLRASLTVLSMWSCTVKLDEENPT